MHIRLVKSRATHASLGFAFAQFPTVEAATEFVQKCYESPISLDGQYLSVTFSHPNSFVMMGSGESNSQWRTTEYFDAEGRYIEIQYWDERAFAKEYPQSPPIDPELIKAALSRDPSTSVLPSTDASQQQEVGQEESKTTESVAEKEPVSSEPGAVSSTEQIPEEQPPSAKKPKVKITAKGKTGVQLQKWQSRQEELAEDEEKAQEPLDLSDEALEKVRPFVPEGDSELTNLSQ
jgi:hypothetical protein